MACTDSYCFNINSVKYPQHWRNWVPVVSKLGMMKYKDKMKTVYRTKKRGDQNVLLMLIDPHMNFTLSFTFCLPGAVTLTHNLH